MCALVSSLLWYSTLFTFQDALVKFTENTVTIKESAKDGQSGREHTLSGEGAPKLFSGAGSAQFIVLPGIGIYRYVKGTPPFLVCKFPAFRDPNPLYSARGWLIWGENTYNLTVWANSKERSNVLAFRRTKAMNLSNGSVFTLGYWNQIGMPVGIVSASVYFVRKVRQNRGSDRLVLYRKDLGSSSQPIQCSAVSLTPAQVKEFDRLLFGTEQVHTFRRGSTHFVLEFASCTFRFPLGSFMGSR